MPRFFIEVRDDHNNSAVLERLVFSFPQADSFSLGQRQGRLIQPALRVCSLSSGFDIVSSENMYKDFHAVDPWTRKEVHCIYQALIVAIATRHADAVDIKFLVDGSPVWIALPHPAWVEYHKRTGKWITDALAVEIAGHYLKSALESGQGVGQEMYSLTVNQTLEHLADAVGETVDTQPVA